MKYNEIHQQLMRLHLTGAPEEEKKALYMLRNSIELSVEQEVWRIFRADDLIKDIEDNKITLSQIGIEGTGKGEPDSGENPFRDQQFKDVDGTKIILAFLDNYFGTCWSIKSLYPRWAWNAFAGNNVGLMVKSTVHKIMDEVCNIDNKFYSVTCYFGRVKYYSDAKLEEWKENTQLMDIIGIGGQGFESIRTLLRLPQTYTREDEARLIFICHEDNDFVLNNVAIQVANNIKLFRHPFIWRRVIDEITVDPRFPTSTREAYADKLKKLPVECSINLY